MKRISLFLLVILLSTGLNAKKLVAYFDYKTFYSPGEGNILETYINFDGTSVYYSTLEDGFVNAKIEVTIIIKKGATEIVDFIKKEVNSPKIKDLEYVNFLDQNRFLLPDGDYNIEVKLKDLNSDTSESSNFTKQVRLISNKNRPFFSDVELLAGYRPETEGSELAKSGL